MWPINGAKPSHGLVVLAEVVRWQNKREREEAHKLWILKYGENLHENSTEKISASMWRCRVTINNTVNALRIQWHHMHEKWDMWEKKMVCFKSCFSGHMILVEQQKTITCICTQCKFAGQGQTSIIAEILPGDSFHIKGGFLNFLTSKLEQHPPWYE